MFESLEHSLYYYHEEDELEIAKRRFEFNRENRIEHNKLTVHWIYWGEVQNYLIPALDQDRISRKSFELERILKRKFNGQHFRHKRNNVIGELLVRLLVLKLKK